jgi:hypothetical protein
VIRPGLGEYGWAALAPRLAFGPAPPLECVWAMVSEFGACLGRGRIEVAVRLLFGETWIYRRTLRWRARAFKGDCCDIEAPVVCEREQQASGQRYRKGARRKRKKLR